MDWRLKALKAKNDLQHFDVLLKEVRKYFDPLSAVNFNEAYQRLIVNHDYTFDELTHVVNVTKYKGKLKQSLVLQVKKFIANGEMATYVQDLRAIFINLVWLMLVVGVSGNFLVISYFISKHWKKLRKMSAYHFLLIMLAVVDGAYCIGISIFHYYEFQLVWKLGSLECVYGLNFIKLWFPMLSYWLVAIIAYER